MTGGLFLGDDAVIPTQLAAISRIRRTSAIPFAVAFAIRSTPRLWIAGGIQYDSGLPFDFDGAYARRARRIRPAGDRTALTSPRGRIDPSFQVNASAGVDIYKSEHLKMRLQADGQNLTNVLDVIDFGGLFSGNAIGPSRSFALRLSTDF